MILDLARQGLSVSAIARRTGHDRKTVRKYLERGMQAPAYTPREPAQSPLAPFHAFLRERVGRFPDLTGRRLWREARDLGFTGGYATVTDFLRTVRPPAEPAAFERRFETPPALPPPAEQSAIAAFLDRETGKIDALVAEQERLIALLREKRQAVISQAVTMGLDPNAPMKDSGVEWLGEVPAHWEVVPLMWLTQPARPIMYGIVLPGPDVGEAEPFAALQVGGGIHGPGAQLPVPQGQEEPEPGAPPGGRTG